MKIDFIKIDCRCTHCNAKLFEVLNNNPKNLTKGSLIVAITCRRCKHLNTFILNKLI